MFPTFPHWWASWMLQPWRYMEIVNSIHPALGTHPPHHPGATSSCFSHRAWPCFTGSPSSLWRLGETGAIQGIPWDPWKTTWPTVPLHSQRCSWTLADKIRHHKPSGFLMFLYVSLIFRRFSGVEACWLVSIGQNHALLRFWTSAWGTNHVKCDCVGYGLYNITCFVALVALVAAQCVPLIRVWIPSWHVWSVHSYTVSLC